MTAILTRIFPPSRIRMCLPVILLAAALFMPGWGLLAEVQAARFTVLGPAGGQEGVTVTVRLRLDGDTTGLTVPLAGLLRDGSAEEGIALYWFREAGGWFPVSNLRLEVPQEWRIPSTGLRLVSDNPSVYDLTTVIPSVNSEYEAVLSYTPDGYLFISFGDVTPGKEKNLYSAILRIDTTVPLVPAVGNFAAVDPRGRNLVSLLNADVTPTYIGRGLPADFKQQFRWNIVLESPDGKAEPLSPLTFFKGDALALELQWPDEEVRGEMTLYLVQDSENRELVRAGWQPGTQTVPLPASLPAGKFTLRLEYVEDDYVETMGTREAENVVAWARIPKADLTKLSVDDFSDDELFMPHTLTRTEKHMPYFLTHFHRVANAVREDGFIDISVWRNQVDNEPYNARVMENILSLAYFYATDRPWNPYYGSEPLRARLEAALRFWVGMQNTDGRFSEYGWQRWNLAATAFATKFMAETLRLLHDGPPIDQALYEEVRQAQRKAIMATLTYPDLYSHGLRFTNQFGNVWPAILAYLQMFPDEEMEVQFRRRLNDAKTAFQSPAGYYYESDSVDWGYNMGTHRHNTRMVWHYGRSSDVIDIFVEGERLWYEWLSYNAVREPDGSAFILNRAIESRTRTGSFTRLDTELAEVIPLARAFATTQSERAEAIAQMRSQLAARWPSVLPLNVGDFQAYSPYTFLHQGTQPWLPSDEQREEATKLLPYLASDSFNHQRADSRYPLVLTYVRRPEYYAVFNQGQARVGRQRFGLGLIWHQSAGALLQSQSESNTTAWGTKAANSPTVYEASIPAADYQVNGTRWTPRYGAYNLPNGDVQISYFLGSQGRKAVVFSDTGIQIDIEHAGAFTEHIPLLVAAGDDLTVNASRAVLTRGNVSLVLEASDGVEVKWTPTSERVGRYTVYLLTIAAEGKLSYGLQVVSEDVR